MSIDWKDLFLSFQGRIGRMHFWIAFLVLVGAGALLQFIPIIGQLLGLALLWPQVAIQAKRLHDMGRTAWFALIPPVVTVLCGVAAAVTGGATVMAAYRRNDADALATAAGGVGLIALFIVLPFLTLVGFLLWIGLSRSQPHDNRYGPPPETP